MVLALTGLRNPKNDTIQDYQSCVILEWANQRIGEKREMGWAGCLLPGDRLRLRKGKNTTSKKKTGLAPSAEKREKKIALLCV